MLVGAVAAGVIAVVAASPASAGTPAARAVLPGGAVPQVAAAQPAGETPATATQNAIVFLKPRNPRLLKRMATRASAGHPLTSAQINRLFVPTPDQISLVENYLQSQGLTVTGRNLLSLSVTGTTAEQEHAFDVDVGLYRSRSGRLFKAPDASPRLPVPVASLVQAVGGLDNSMKLYHAATSAPVHPATVNPTGCTGANGAHSAYTGTLLPAQLGAPGGYNHNVLVNGGSDGSGEAIAFVEFSNYKSSDITTYRSCFPAISSPGTVRVNVNGGTSVMSGAGEVVLDVQTAISAAPDAATYVYVAPNNIANGVAMINRMVADQSSTHVRIVSDSWGLCEPVMSASIMGAENTALQLAAAAGMSFFVATGDDGSSGCARVTGSTAVAAVDPASQPFATAVGGTRLVPASPRNEVAWRDGGGGASIFFPKPSWQLGRTLTLANNGARCGNPGGQCRQIPDISLNASPNTGYIIFCSVNSSACGGLTGWLPIGGTSASAPLMAGITADMNEYSLSNGGPRLGYANPFLYAPSTISSGSYHDITKGGNSITGGSLYNARKGYDLATGLGSVDAVKLADALAHNGAPSVTPHTSSLTAVTPLANKTFAFGKRITFSGKLTDTTSSKPISRALITIQLSTGHLRAATKLNGTWSVSITRKTKLNIRWRAVYAGAGAHKPALPTPYRRLHIVPHL